MSDTKPPSFHLTLAYLIPGMSWLYVGEGLGGQEISFDRIVFSDKNRNVTEIVLRDLWDENMSCPSCGGSVKKLTDGTLGWRCEHPPCEWALNSAGAENDHMEAPGGLTTIHDQTDWERANDDRFDRSDVKGFSKPALGNDFVFYLAAFNRWRVKPDVMTERRIRLGWERSTPPNELAAQNDEEFRLTHENNTQESQLYKVTHPDRSIVPGNGTDTCPDGTPLNRNTQTCTGHEGKEGGYPGVDELHIEDEGQYSNLPRSYDTSKAKKVRPSPFGKKSIYDAKCPDGSSFPIGSGSCQGRYANSWDGVVDIDNEPGWPDYPDYAPVVGVDTRPSEEREKPIVGREALVEKVRSGKDLPTCPAGEKEPPVAGSCGGDDGWKSVKDQERCPDGTPVPKATGTCSGREGFIPWTEEERLQRTLLEPPKGPATSQEHGPIVAKYPNDPPQVRPSPFGLKKYGVYHHQQKPEVFHPEQDTYCSIAGFTLYDDSGPRVCGQANSSKAMSAMNPLTGGSLRAPAQFAGARIGENKKRTKTILTSMKSLVHVKALPPAQHGHQPTLAIDVDGTLCDTPPHTGRPPEMESLKPRDGAPEAMRALHDAGWLLLIWTVRDDYSAIEEWLNKHDIPFDYINENPNQPTSSPKIIADHYIDDRAISPDDWTKIAEELDDTPKQMIESDAGYDKLAKMAEQAIPELGELLSGLKLPTVELEEVKEATPIGFIIAPFLKGRERAEEKVASDYNGDWSRLLDVVRATVAVDSLEELEKAVEVVSKCGKVVRAKNRFAAPLSNGYRDYLMNLQLPSGVIAEVQFHLTPILKVREQEKQVYDRVRQIEAALKEEGRDSMTDEEIEAIQEAQEESSQLFEQAWQESQKPKKKDKRLPIKKLTPPTVESSPLFNHWMKYYVKESGFTGERFDVTGRRYCYAGGRKVPCRPKGAPAEKVNYQAPKIAPNKFQTTPAGPTTGRGKISGVEAENPRATMLLYAVIFNSDGQMLVRNDDSWGGFIWSGKRNGFIKDLEKATGYSLKTVGMVNNASEGQGYYVLQAEGELAPQQKSLPRLGKADEPVKPPEPPKPPKQLSVDDSTPMERPRQQPTGWIDDTTPMERQQAAPEVPPPPPAPTPPPVEPEEPPDEDIGPGLFNEDLDRIDDEIEANEPLDEMAGLQEEPFHITGEGRKITQMDMSFLTSIKENPNDNSPRLIYADWLEETGQPSNEAMAEAIRSRISVSQSLTRGDTRTAIELLDRLNELEAENPEWFWPWGRRTDGSDTDRFAQFDRGTLSVNVPANDFMAILEQVGPERALAMVERVKLSGESYDIASALISNDEAISTPSTSWLQYTPSLDLSSNPQLLRFQFSIMYALINNRHTESLRKLNLRNTGLGSDDGYPVVMAMMYNLPNLTHLDLSYNNLSEDSVDVLINTPGLQNMQKLTLSGNNISQEQWQALRERYGNALRRS